MASASIRGGAHGGTVHRLAPGREEFSGGTDRLTGMVTARSSCSASTEEEPASGVPPEGASGQKAGKGKIRGLARGTFGGDAELARLEAASRSTLV